MQNTPLTMESSRQEYWNGQPFPSPRDLPDPGIEPRSPELQADSLPHEPGEVLEGCVFPEVVRQLHICLSKGRDSKRGIWTIDPGKSIHKPKRNKTVSKRTF